MEAFWAICSTKEIVISSMQETVRHAVLNQKGVMLHGHLRHTPKFAALHHTLNAS